MGVGGVIGGSHEDFRTGGCPGQPPGENEK